jgi:excisionase family DNA binding protein
MSERLYPPRRAAELLGITTKTLKAWERAGKIKCVRTVGGHRRIPESEIRRLQGTITPPPQGVMYKVIERDGRKVFIPL